MKKIVLVLIVLFFIVPSAHAVREWAEIYQGQVRGIHQMPDNLIPVFRPSSFLIAVEITSLDPKPAAGWKYDLETDTFSLPDTVYRTVITAKEFFSRMTETEQEDFISASGKKTKKFMYFLSLFGDIDLMDQKVIDAVDALEDAGIIGPGRAAVLLIREEQ